MSEAAVLRYYCLVSKRRRSWGNKQALLPVRASVSRGQRVGMGKKRRTWSLCRTDKWGRWTPPSSLDHLWHPQCHSWPGQTGPGRQRCCLHCCPVGQRRRPLPRICVHLFGRWGMEWAQVQAGRVTTSKLLGKHGYWQSSSTTGKPLKLHYSRTRTYKYMS